MGNHYDPSEDRLADESKRGSAMKRAIAAKSGWDIQSSVNEIMSILHETEDAVIGGKAVDRLRRARRLLLQLVGE